MAVGEVPAQEPLMGICDEAKIVNSTFANTPGMGICLIEDPAHRDMVRVLGDGFDLIHFAGYGESDEVVAGMAKIDLADRPFRLRSLYGPLSQQLQRRQPVVFLNSGGGSGAWLGGWADGWIKCGGASVFIAPLWPVRDVASLTFC